jgi:hypothetical protein
VVVETAAWLAVSRAVLPPFILVTAQLAFLILVAGVVCPCHFIVSVRTGTTTVGPATIGHFCLSLAAVKLAAVDALAPVAVQGGHERSLATVALTFRLSAHQMEWLCSCVLTVAGWVAAPPLTGRLVSSLNMKIVSSDSSNTTEGKVRHFSQLRSSIELLWEIITYQSSVLGADARGQHSVLTLNDPSQKSSSSH